MQISQRMDVAPVDLAPELALGAPGARCCHLLMGPLARAARERPADKLFSSQSLVGGNGRPAGQTGPSWTGLDRKGPV